jgi:hypothetical protein
VRPERRRSWTAVPIPYAGSVLDVVTYTVEQPRAVAGKGRAAKPRARLPCPRNYRPGAIAMLYVTSTTKPDAVLPVKWIVCSPGGSGVTTR